MLPVIWYGTIHELRTMHQPSKNGTKQAIVSASGLRNKNQKKRNHFPRPQEWAATHKAKTFFIGDHILPKCDKKIA